MANIETFTLNENYLKHICKNMYTSGLDNGELSPSELVKQFDTLFENICKDINNQLSEKLEKPIDKVTITNLDIALRMCGYNLDRELIDNIIDLVELIEDKGDDISIRDVTKMQQTWKNT